MWNGTGMTEGSLKIGDNVRLIGIPPDTRDDEELRTRTSFEKCLGKIFAVAGLETVEGLPFQLVRLDVGHILGQAPELQTIWVEPEYLELARSD
jgi:hypothetical protein